VFASTECGVIVYDICSYHQVSRLEEVGISARQEIDLLRRENAEFRATTADLRASNESYIAVLGTKDDGLQISAALCRKLQENLALAENERDRVREELEQHRVAVSEAKAACALLHMQVDQRRQEFQREREQTQRLGANNAYLEGEQQRLQKALEVAYEQVQDLKVTLSRYRRITATAHQSALVRIFSSNALHRTCQRTHIVFYPSIILSYCHSIILNTCLLLTAGRER
jgi:chromosome segregation ATPase